MSGPWDPAGKVDVLDVLEVLEIENVRREGYHEARFSCPYPGHENGDMSASAYMNLETCAWFCHGCKRKGSVVSFTASILSISPMKAKRLLRQAYDPSSLNPDDRDMVRELKEFFEKTRSEPVSPTNEPIGDEFVERFEVDWQAVAESDEAPEQLTYMLERGFDTHTLEYWRFGYDEYTDRIVFPVTDEWGNVIGFKGRAWDDRHPKYLVVGDDNYGRRSSRYGFPRYYTGSVVFGLGEVVGSYLEILEHGEDATALIYEGELNSVASWQMGYRNSVALNGSNLTDHQTRLIRTFFERAVFMFDPDKAGERGMWGWDDEETGEHHLGALEKLSFDLDVFIARTGEDDAADLLKEGREEELDTQVSSAEPYVVARLRRELVTSQAPHQ